MKHVTTQDARSSFRVLLESADAQAAIMNLRPGQTSGELGNEHPRAEQWLYVIAGRGTLRFGNRRRTIDPGSLVLIRKGEIHQVVNDQKRTILRTLNVYVPPAYTKTGEVKSRVKR